MSGHKRIPVLVLAAVLALTSFPFPASAAGEDILEPAPEVILPEETPVPETDTEGGTAPVFGRTLGLPGVYCRLFFTYSVRSEKGADAWNCLNRCTT